MFVLSLKYLKNMEYCALKKAMCSFDVFNLSTLVPLTE